MATIPSRPPRVRQFSMKSLAFAVGGREAKYPVYRFSQGRYKYERPKHNPFEGL